MVYFIIYVIGVSIISQLVYLYTNQYVLMSNLIIIGIVITLITIQIIMKPFYDSNNDNPFITNNNATNRST